MTGGYRIYDANTWDRLHPKLKPEKIRCVRCKKAKSHAFFAKKRLNHFAEAILQEEKGKKDKPSASKENATMKKDVISCTQCTNSVVNERDCTECSVVKPRSAFAKRQFNSDNRKCIACQNEINNTEANARSSDEDDYEDSYADGSDSDDSLAGTRAGTSVGAGGSTSAGRSHASSSLGGGVALNHENSTPYDGRIKTSSVDTPYRYAASENVSVASTHAFGGGIFAKIRAPRRPSPESVEERAMRESLDNVTVASDEDDDDEY